MRYISIRYLFLFSFIFAVCAVVGTVSHELGHYAMAKYFGCSAKVHYAAMSNSPSEFWKHIIDIREAYQYEVENDLEFEQKAEYDAGIKRLIFESRMITVGGPLQTVLVGTVGLVFLLFRRKKIQRHGFSFIDWVWVFMALFWLREVFNLVTGTIKGLFWSPDYPIRGDEARLSVDLFSTPWVIPLGAGILGAAVVLYVIFRIVPSKLRFTFILSGFLGGISGFALWMFVLGPIILP